MISKTPKISVIIPSYNQGQYLAECLQSVFHQTYQNWECIIINDGSTDNSLIIAEEWRKKDDRFIVINKKNEGVTRARNLGLDKASGEWIQMLDADDIIAPKKFEHSIANANNANLIVCNFDMLLNGIHQNGFCDLSKYDINFTTVLKGWDVDFNIPIHSVLISKDLLENTKFSIHLKAKEDWIFWLQILKKDSCKVKYLPEILATYRENSLGASKKFDSVYKDMKEAYTYLYHHYDEEVKTLLFEKINLSNYEIHKTAFLQKKYIKQLQNTKILKLYLKIRNFFN